MMKTIKNRILNAILLSFMATFGWFVLGLLVKDGGIIFALKFSGVMFLMLLLVFSIWMFSDVEFDFLEQR